MLSQKSSGPVVPVKAVSPYVLISGTAVVVSSDSVPSKRADVGGVTWSGFRFLPDVTDPVSLIAFLMRKCTTGKLKCVQKILGAYKREFQKPVG